MASVILVGREAIDAAYELVRGAGFIAFNLEPDRVQTARIIAPFIDTPEHLTQGIEKFVMAGWLNASDFVVREDVPPAESAGGIVGVPILAGG